VIVVDTSFVYALLDRRDRRHREAAAWYAGVAEAVATTPLVVAEVDHLAGSRAGSGARAAFRRDLAAGAYLVEWWRGAEEAIVGVAETYRELGVSLADASLAALAARLRTTAVATFDERHFRALRPLDGAAAFTLLPRDAR
jgi:uncharacterized protein